MKKLITTFLLAACLALAGIAQTTETGSTAPPTKSKTRSTAVWIGAGVVVLVLVIAANRRRKRNGE